MPAVQLIDHPCFEKDFERVTGGHDGDLLVVQLVEFLRLIETSHAIASRLLTHHEQLSVNNADGKPVTVNIKVIQSWKEDANDARYFTDAIRRIRDIYTSPLNDYRVFFVPRLDKDGSWYQLLGIFHKNDAYSESTGAELRRRYAET